MIRECKNCGFDESECACCPECGEFDGCLCELKEDIEHCKDCGSHGMVCTCYDDVDLNDLDEEDFDADDYMEEDYYDFD